VSGIAVRLSSQELHEATCLGQDADAICQKVMGYKPRDPGSNKVQSEIDGARAEYAVAKLYGLEKPTLNILGDGGKDLWFGDVSLDVKFTNTNDLIFDDIDAFKAGVAVLVKNHGDDPRMLNVVGCVSSEGFAANSTAQERKYGTKLCMRADELSPPETLWRFAVERALA
jgi:hypothetical protein